MIPDAANDFSVPDHLMTAEYNSLIQRLLRPQGVYLLTVIDAMESGRFLDSAVRTVEKSFGETRLPAPQETYELQDRSVYIIAGRFSENVASPGPFNGSQSPEWWSSRSSAFVFPKRDVDNLLTRRANESPLLTDDYAPVDMLMTSHFVTYSR